MKNLWKIRRELDRLGQQLRALPEMVTEPLALRRHNRQLAKGFPLHHGQVAQSDKVALVLIYQPRSIPPSLQQTCDALVTRGYCPLIISNAALSDPQRDALLPHVWRILERPNFGYDFGGYRDGILSLEAWGITPERLLILNDSVWPDIYGGYALFKDLEQNDDAITGSILRERGDIRFLESYIYSIPKSILGDPAFHAFWRDLKLTSNKYKVIRRGERGFSVAMAQAGFRLCPLFTKTAFLTKVEQAPDAELVALLRYASHVYDDFEDERRALLGAEQTDTWREAVLAHIVRTLDKEQFYSAYPYGAIHLLGYPLLKKSRDRVAQGWRAAFARAVRDGALPPPAPTLSQEVSCLLPEDLRLE